MGEDMTTNGFTSIGTSEESTSAWVTLDLIGLCRISTDSARYGCCKSYHQDADVEL